jgi:hypothetical protein
MTTTHIITTAITAAALATVCACNKDNRDNARTVVPVDQTPIARNAPPAEGQDVNAPITVTGCLQKESGFGTTYIVTSVNEPSQKGIGTTGNGAAVEREQLREAANAYRVESKDKVDMDSIVGKEVRVSGTIAKRADLPDVPVAAPNQTGTVGKDEARQMEKIDKGDLAKIDDASISVVSDNCGGHADRASGAKARPAAGKKNRG